MSRWCAHPFDNFLQDKSRRVGVPPPNLAVGSGRGVKCRLRRVFEYFWGSIRPHSPQYIESLVQDKTRGKNDEQAHRACETHIDKGLHRTPYSMACTHHYNGSGVEVLLSPDSHGQKPCVRPYHDTPISQNPLSPHKVQERDILAL